MRISEKVKTKASKDEIDEYMNNVDLIMNNLSKFTDPNVLPELEDKSDLLIKAALAPRKPVNYQDYFNKNVSIRIKNIQYKTTLNAYVENNNGKHIFHVNTDNVDFLINNISGILNPHAIKEINEKKNTLTKQEKFCPKSSKIKLNKNHYQEASPKQKHNKSLDSLQSTLVRLRQEHKTEMELFIERLEMKYANSETENLD